MRILHLTSTVGLRSYGLGQVALNLVKAQRTHGHDAVIWSLDPEEERQRSLALIGLPTEAIRRFDRVGPELLAWSPAMMRAAAVDGKEFDIVHQHGIWTAISRVTNLLRTQHGRLTVVGPQGSLEPYALRKSRWKKRVALWAYESANLRGASCIHAVTTVEVAQAAAFSPHSPVALIANGISQAWLDSTGDGARFRSRFGIPGDRRVVLFMSRIAPKKGLPMLLQAWSGLRDSHPKWNLVVIGGDEDGHKAEVESLARQLDLTDHILFVDPVIGQDKRDAFAAAELFVLPTRSEGFPMVVLEALGAGVPAIVSRGAAWEDLEVHGCGWWVDISVDAIGAAMRDALGREPANLSAMGAAARGLVESKYHWRYLSLRTVELYQWLHHQGPTPAFVTLPAEGSRTRALDPLNDTDATPNRSQNGHPL